ncbi:MAG: hypothetical protein ACI85K_000669, partial [Hyphomicrobiaceae bacterium]
WCRARFFCGFGSADLCARSLCARSLCARNQCHCNLCDCHLGDRNLRSSNRLARFGLGPRNRFGPRNHSARWNRKVRSICQYPALKVPFKVAHRIAGLSHQLTL